LDARGRSVIPGLIDAHTHIFDWLYNVDEAVRHSIKHGVTTIITETEDIYYQCEHRCFIPMLESIGGQPIKIYATIPPIATYDEYSQGLPEDLFDKLIGNAFVLGLGESYWQFVVGKDERILRLYLKVLSAGKSIEGHSAGAKGAKLAAYAAIGTSSCHEPTTSEEFLERLRMGMHVMIREGSVRRDLPGVRGALLSGVALDNVSLVSDSVSPTDLIRWGYMDAVVQEAMDLGVDPIDAIRMATLNPARHFRLDTLTGSLAPGRCADIVLIPSINKVKPDVVVSNGRIVFSSGSIIVEPARPQLDGCRGCLKLPERVTASDFRIVAPGDRVT
ncbi:amidohydrolase family protein, partial [Thermogutta sp.]|uniref:amidohydrolase family protein n=1 Tax=Thermogutta sp. TaxID=1962930 RepID=UPI0032201B7F